MARYRVQTASGRFYDVDLSEGEDIESVVAEIERSEAPVPSAGGGRGDSINPPMAGQQQPVFPRLSTPAPAPIDYGQAATDMMGTPMAAPPAPVAAPAPAKPAPYKNRLEALDDAVNLVEEGADFKRVAQSFTQIGIGEGDIIAHGIGRKSPMFQDPA